MTPPTPPPPPTLSDPSRDLVRITDVAPRDGLQNEPQSIPTADKARLIRALCDARVDEVEVTSFVSPRWIPQLADADDLLRLLRDEPPASPRPIFSALVPNEKGMHRALSLLDEGCPLEKVAVFAAASETFSQRNINASIAESLERFEPVAQLARAHNLAGRGYVSCAIACPFEGTISPERVARVAMDLYNTGFEEIDLGDTIGAAGPETTAAMLDAVLNALPSRATVTLHLHDTFGRASGCVREALRLGVRSFDASVGGLGGCPYASTPTSRAPGNISTERILVPIAQEGCTTGLSIPDLDRAGSIARGLTHA